MQVWNAFDGFFSASAFGMPKLKIFYIVHGQLLFYLFFGAMKIGRI